MNLKIATFLLLLYPFFCIGKNELTIRNKYRNLGVVAIGTKITERYYLVNNTNKNINIQYVNPECSCTDFSVSAYQIPPQDSICVDLKVDTTNKYGDETIYTIIKTDSEVSMYKLTLRFFVKDAREMENE